MVFELNNRCSIVPKFCDLFGAAAFFFGGAGGPAGSGAAIVKFEISVSDLSAVGGVASDSAVTPEAGSEGDVGALAEALSLDVVGDMAGVAAMTGAGATGAAVGVLVVTTADAFAGAAMLADAAGNGATAGVTLATGAACTLVTMARAASGVFSASTVE